MTHETRAMTGATYSGGEEINVWGPSLVSEGTDAWLRWVNDLATAGYRAPWLILNGPGSDEARLALCGHLAASGHDAVVISSPVASIGEAQLLAIHRLLGEGTARYLVRLDVDLQFPAGRICDLLQAFRSEPRPDVVWAQRDEAGGGGRLRFAGNVLLRLLAEHAGCSGDVNSGFYALNRTAAAVIASVAPTRFPEPRMLAAFRDAGLSVVTCVAPTLPRQHGRSSLGGVLRGAGVFVSSALEMM